MEPIDYNSYALKCVEELKVVQDKFQQEYDVDWYDKWFYNQTTGLLTFSKGEVEINFKYFEVGSFSEKSNTWKWSWDNDDVLDNIKDPAKHIKRFGQSSKYPKLTIGYFPGDEFEAWEFTAIAAKLSNAIGVYRPVTVEGLKIFVVITEFVDKDEAEKIKDRFIECSVHEYRRIAFVCQHLNHTNEVGFNEAFETFEDMDLTDDDDFQAWCNRCEEVRKIEGEWNEKSMAFAEIKIVCEKCYFEMKKLNLRDS